MIFGCFDPDSDPDPDRNPVPDPDKSAFLTHLLTFS